MSHPEFNKSDDVYIRTLISLFLTLGLILSLGLYDLLLVVVDPQLVLLLKPVGNTTLVRLWLFSMVCTWITYVMRQLGILDDDQS